MNLVVFIMKSIKEQVEYLRDFVVDEINALFDRLIQERTDYVTVVLEDLFQSHNQSAVMRSADCYGIQHVHLIENRNSYDMTSTVSQGARDWLSIHRHKELENNTQATIDQLRAEGYRILATTPHANDIFVDDIDLEKGKMAFFFGTELTGLSDLVIGQADEFVKISGCKIKAVFSDVRPNPTTDNVDDCVKIMREIKADFAVALGGGSPMDCCKAASAIAKGNDKIRSYHSEGKKINKDEAIPMIAVTTTSGTASEVTNISVLTDVEKNLKNPMNDPAMYPKIAIIDPQLTLTVPPQVTASTGLDVLSHAIESYWATIHQPVCSACSIYSARLVFEWLEKAYQNPNDLTAREKMAEASIVGGVAFSHTRNTGSHA